MSKVIVITGASAGIGAAILKSLAIEGHVVIGLARRAELIDAVKEENADWKIHSYQIDLTDGEKVVEAFDWIRSEFGKIDVLINNAGVADLTFVKDGDIAVWKKVYELNVFAIGSCTREALKMLAEDAQIINVSSTLGQEYCTYPGSAIYSSSKHALKVLTRGLRLELTQERPDIKITLLNPGLVESEMTSNIIKEHPEIPYLSVDHITQVVLFVVSTPKFVNVTELTVQHSAEFTK